ncbi:MAG: hypothetical protein IJ747_05265 [Lachnospiraceae bacterium]|nr:hypothetical protein [Lachnospiraceae bacterium]
MERVTLFLKYFLTLILSVLVGASLLIIVYKLPVGRATQNVVSSIGYLGGDFPDWSGSTFTVSDGFTDLIMINTSIFNGRDNAVYYALQSPHIEFRKEYVQYQNLLGYLGEREEPVETPYSRYWHGYVIVLKPLLAFFTVQEIRLLNAMIQGFLLLLLLYLLNSVIPRNSRLVMLAYGVSLFMICPFTVSLCFQYSTVYYIILISCIALILMRNILRRNGRYGLFFYFLGIVTAYFDFLTYPAAALGFALITCFLIRMEQETDRSMKSICVDALGKSIVWLAGYGLMWASKWVLAEVFTGAHVISDALEAIRFRTSDSGLSEGFNLFEPVLEPLEAFAHAIILMPAAAFLLCILVLLRKKYRFHRSLIRANTIYLLIACYPFLWCSVLRNHSVQHPYIVFRLFSLSILGILVFLSQIVIESTPEKEHPANDEQE